MSRWLTLGTGLALLFGASVIPQGASHLNQRVAGESGDSPQFTVGRRLVRPANYRQWIYLSSGLGMQYGASAGQPQKFTNVFVQPAAWRHFLSSGRWPDRVVFVVEERASSSRGSISRAGHYQTDLMGLGVEVKDSKRFPERWAYYLFGPSDQTAVLQPQSACWQCHEDHGAVEHTFVQFYPTLSPIARRFHTYDAAKAATH